MSQKQTALGILEEAKHAFNKLGELIKKLEDAIGETPTIQSADDGEGGNSPSEPPVLP
jgi:hypothetical protein